MSSINGPGQNEPRASMTRLFVAAGVSSVMTITLSVLTQPALR
jgi:hypothetical protein